MIHFLRLIRLPNLLMIVFIQYMMRWCIIYPVLNNYPIKTGIIYRIYELELQFDGILFLFLVLSTVLIAAAGYIINDYFDADADFMNRPEKVIIGKHISQSAAKMWYIIFNIIAFGLGVYISVAIRWYQLSFIYPIIIGLLWYYSTTYKRQLLIGNIIIALLAASVPFIVLLYEMPVLHRFYHKLVIDYNVRFQDLWYWISGYAFFAFITTLHREIIKDMEDFEGDAAYGVNSLPVVLGIKGTKISAIVLNIVLITALILVYFYFLDRNIMALWYFSIGLFLPLLFIIFKTIRAQTKNHYRFISILSKLLMIVGVGFAFVVRYVYMQ